MYVSLFIFFTCLYICLYAIKRNILKMLYEHHMRIIRSYPNILSDAKCQNCMKEGKKKRQAKKNSKILSPPLFSICKTEVETFRQSYLANMVK